MSGVDYTIEWRKLERKLSGMERFAPKNAMKAAATSAFRVIDFENAKLAKAGPYVTPAKRPSFRQRASKKGGYRYKIRQAKDGSTSAQSMYNKWSKYPELFHAKLVEYGWESKGGPVPGRGFRQTAFNRKKRAAQRRIVEAMRIAIKLACKHPKGRVRPKDVEQAVGGWGS